MNTLDILLVAIALSLDAFSVAISCGIKLKKDNYSKFIKISLAFGLFQAIMPILSFMLTHSFIRGYFESYAKWIAFAVFFSLGLKTIYDFYIEKNETEDKNCECQDHKCLTTLAFATSIDAFLIGFVLGIHRVSLLIPVIVIGLITFIHSIIGCILGNKSVTILQEKSRLIAALILILLAVKSVL